MRPTDHGDIVNKPVLFTVDPDIDRSPGGALKLP
jgi:hypothetical protein